MTELEIEALVERAAKEGARQALEQIGLHDEGAVKDVLELRSLIGSWREVKKTAIQTFVRWTTLGILGLLAAGWWWQNHK